MHQHVKGTAPLNVPLSYFFCEDEMSAELVCLFEKLNEKEKAQLIAILRDDTLKWHTEFGHLIRGDILTS